MVCGDIIVPSHRVRKVIGILICWGIPLVSTVLVLLISYIRPEGWFIDLLAFGVPVILLLNLLLIPLILLFSRRWKYWLPPLLLLLFSVKPIRETINYHPDRDTICDFTVMSYNIATFNPQRMEQKKSNSYNNASLYNWLRQNRPPDILCLQEFYHSDLDDYDNTLDSILRIGGYRYFYMNPVYKDEFKGIFGVITFSRFRSLKSGPIKYGEHYMNKGIYHDFVIGKDTVRLLNFHLNSMSIRLNNSDTLSFKEYISYNARNIYNRLHSGYHHRRTEIAEVQKFIDDSPYKVIACADMNAVPYSYTYQKMRRTLRNAFEDAGNGFGFSYNRFPYYIRIDNQFYDERLQVKFYRTHTEMKASDHYPIEAGYSFRKK